MNKAAERLKLWMGDLAAPKALVDEALATERRATVERIRDAFYNKGWVLTGNGMEGDVQAILDAEAER